MGQACFAYADGHRCRAPQPAARYLMTASDTINVEGPDTARADVRPDSDLLPSGLLWEEDLRRKPRRFCHLHSGSPRFERKDCAFTFSGGTRNCVESDSLSMAGTLIEVSDIAHDVTVTFRSVLCAKLVIRVEKEKIVFVDRPKCARP